MGLLLCNVALLLLLALIGPALIAGLFRTIGHHVGNKWMRNTAVAIDQFGNVFCGPMFCLVLIHVNGYAFGIPGETISSVLGKNQRDNTLTALGRAIVNILDFIQKDHCKNAIR